MALRQSDDEIGAAREGEKADPRIRVLLQLASAINIGRGDDDDGIVEGARAAGATDGEIARW
jgi:hypothetical protein